MVQLIPLISRQTHLGLDGGDIKCCEGYSPTYSGQQKGVLYFILQMKNLSLIVLEGSLFCMLFGSVLSKSVSCSGDFSTVAARI